MKFIHLIENRAHEIIDEINPQFHDVPITERYSPEFLALCVIVNDEDIPPIGYVYENGVFVEPPAPIVIEKTAEEKRIEIETAIAELQNKLIELGG